MNLQLRKYRKQYSMTQGELAKKVGTTLRVISAWERGETPLPLADAARIADVFAVSLDELAGRDWPPGGSPALAADERGLVDSYRLMDGEQRGKFRDMAGTFVMASEKDGPGAVRDVGRAGVAVT